MFDIDKGIEMPNPCKSNARIYPFNKMDIGDSFYVPLESMEHSKDPDHALSSAARSYARRANNGFQYAVRQVKNDDDALVGFRIWRIK